MRRLVVLLVAIFMCVLLESVSADKDTSSSGYFKIKGDSEKEDNANEPDSVLGYLFKEALAQMGAQGQRADNTVSASESGDYDHEYFDLPDPLLADSAEDHSATKQQGLIERLFGGDSASSSSGNGPDDPVFNFIMTYSALALLAQAFITPFGFVSGKKKRHVSDG